MKTVKLGVGSILRLIRLQLEERIIHWEEYGMLNEHDWYNCQLDLCLQLTLRSDNVVDVEIKRWKELSFPEANPKAIEKFIRIVRPEPVFILDLSYGEFKTPRQGRNEYEFRENIRDEYMHWFDRTGLQLDHNLEKAQVFFQEQLAPKEVV